MTSNKWQIVAAIILFGLILSYSWTRPLVPERVDPLQGTENNQGYDY